MTNNFHDPAFVGRAAELDALLQLKTSPGVVWVSGVGGVGKSSLTRQYTESIRASGARVCWVACESVNPSLASVRELLSTSLELIGVKSLADFGDPNDLLVIDGAETIADVLEWLFGSAIPVAKPSLSIIISSRMAPPAKMLSIGLRHIALPAFTLAETRAQLRALGVNKNLEEQARDLHAITDGHPLANALAARGGAIDLSATTRALDTLAGQFVSRLDASERALCELLSLQRSLDVAICSDLISNAPALIEKLERFSFFHRVGSRLSLHTTVRDALYTRFSALHPGRLREMSRTVIRALFRASRSDFPSLYSTLMSAFFCVRADESVNQLLPLRYLAQVSPHELTDDLKGVVADAVRRHEGEAAANAFLQGYARGDIFGSVVRDARDEVIAVQCCINNLHALKRLADIDDIAAHMVKTVELSGLQHEPLLLPRYFFAVDTYQDFSPAMGCAMLLNGFAHATVHPHPTHIIFSMSPPAIWRDLGEQMDVDAVPGAEREIGGRPRQGFIAEAALHFGSTGTLHEIYEQGALFLTDLLDDNPSPSAQTKVYSNKEWVDALRSAMRLRDRPLQLTGHALLSMCQVGHRDALFELLERACGRLEEGADYADAIATFRVTFLGEGMKQEAAAAELGLAYGTYRYRLRRGIELVAEQLRRSAAQSAS